MERFRLRAAMRTNAFSGVFEDDAGKFFDRHPSRVSSADLWRWRAACAALRELDGEK